MIVALRELGLWFPLVIAAALALLVVITDAPALLLALGAIDARLFAKIERIRSHGIRVDTVCEQVAEQHGVDAEQLAVEHFEQLLADSPTYGRPRYLSH